MQASAAPTRLDLAEALWSNGWADSSGSQKPAHEIGPIFEQLRLPVYRYLLGVLRSPAEAEEITQEAFVRLLEEVQAGRRVREVRTWIFRVARNLAMDLYRQPMKYVTERLADRAAGGRDPEQLAIEQERMRRHEQALARLSSQEHQCLELRLEGLRYREIAAVLGISISSVATFLTRALTKLTERADK